MIKLSLPLKFIIFALPSINKTTESSKIKNNLSKIITRKREPTINNENKINIGTGIDI